MSSRPLRLLILMLYLLAIAGVLSFASLKRAALAYGEVDFPFYAQFAARLSAPHLSDTYALQPRGYNFIGYVGIDGRDNLHQSIHLEPVKYVYALIYRIIPDPLAIVGFIALVYFLPILYVAHIHPAERTQDRLFILAFALLYISIPSTVYMVTHDLRPRILLIPAFALALLAVHYQRPLREKLLLFGLLFLVREEALLFGTIILLYHTLHTPPGPERTRTTVAFGLLWLGFVLITSVYFLWTGYETDPVYQPFHLFLTQRRLYRGLAISGSVVAVLLFAWGWFHARKRPWLREILQILAYTTGFIPLLVQLATMLPDWLLADAPSNREMVDRFLYSPNTTMLFVAALLLLMLIRNSLKAPNGLTALQTVFLLLGLGFLSLQLTHLAATVADYTERANQAAIIRPLRAETDPYTSRILADYHTYQAFFDYEHILVYQRFPWQIAGDARYYPDNLPYLQRSLHDTIDIIVIHAENRPVIQELLNAVALQPLRVVENETFQIIYLR